MNFTRSQVYNSKKEDVEKLKTDFEEGGYNSLSDYFKELIMLGYDAKKKEGTVSVMAEMKKIKKSIMCMKDDVSFLKKCVYELYMGMERTERKGSKGNGGSKEFDREVFEAAVQRVIIGEESKGVIDSFMMNFILKSSFFEPGSARDVDTSKVMAIDEFDIDYRHFVFAKGDDGFKTKKILPKVKVRFSLDIVSHEK